jgi:hypothetical protein
MENVCVDAVENVVEPVFGRRERRQLDHHSEITS